MSDFTLINELAELSAKLDEAVRLMARYGREYAQAEHDYKVQLSQTALTMRANDMPVTLISQVIYGKPEVAEKRLKRDIAEAMYSSSKENINKLKLQIRILDSQIEREHR